MEINKQSSVEWLEQKILYIVPSSQKEDLIKLVEQAKAMHNKEMKEMYLKGIENYDPTFKRKDNETFGGNK